MAALKCLQGAADAPDADSAVRVSGVEGGAVCRPVEAGAVRQLRLLSHRVELGAQLVHDRLALQIPDLYSFPTPLKCRCATRRIETVEEHGEAQDRGSGAQIGDSHAASSKREQPMIWH
jgi:hypothetical protein